MMSLSPRAQKSLSRIGRSIESPNPHEVGQKLLDAGFAALDPVIETFVNFGGFWHPLGAVSTFKIYSVETAIKQSHIGDNSRLPNEFRIAFGRHPTAQFSFLLDGNAQVYADTILIADSVSEWIESHVIMEMVERWKKCVRIVLPEPEHGFVNWANSQMRIERLASGSTSTWWLGSEWALNRFLPWSVDRSERWNWLFATNLQNGQRLAKNFTQTFGLEPQMVTDWPS